MDRATFVSQHIEDFNIIITETTGRLYDTWIQLYGPNHPKLLDMKEKLLEYYKDFSNDLIESQVKKLSITIRDVDELIEKRDSIICALGIHGRSEIIEDGSLVDKKDRLLKEVKELEETADRLWESYQSVKDEFIGLCRRLNEDGERQMNVIELPRIPSQNDISELKGLLDRKTVIANDRLKELLDCKKQLTFLQEQLELDGFPDGCTNLISEEEEDWDLSPAYIGVVKDEVLNVRVLLDKRQSKKESLLEKLTSIWDKIYLDKESRRLFLDQHGLFGVATLQSINEEIKASENRRKNMIAPLTDKVKKEIKEKLEAMGRQMDPELTEFMNSDHSYTEGFLAALEEHYNILNIELNENSELFDAIKKREQVWKAWVECELNSLDPQRYQKYRGQDLQRELKVRQNLEKKLPSLDKIILLQCENYFKRYNKVFLWNGQKMTDIFENQIAELEQLKESARSALKEKKCTKGKGPVKTPKKLLVTQARTPNQNQREVRTPECLTPALSSLASYSDFISPNRTPDRRPVNIEKPPIPAAHSSPLSDVIVISPDNPSIINITSGSDNSPFNF